MITFTCNQGPLGEFLGVQTVEIDGTAYTPEEVAAIVRACVSGGRVTFSVRAAQMACRAVEEGCVCGARTYAGHLYCPKHQMRFERHGDPVLKLQQKERQT